MPKKRSKFQTKAEYYAVRALLGAIGLLPLKTSMKAGESLGKTIVSLFPRLKKTGRRNLEIALPDLPAGEKENRSVIKGGGRGLQSSSFFIYPL